jgi:hypothetical protein
LRARRLPYETGCGERMEQVLRLSHAEARHLTIFAAIWTHPLALILPAVPLSDE